MFLVEKDSVIDTKGANNLTILMTSNSISTLIDSDRHKFETFADALWWGIVCIQSDFYNYLNYFLFSLVFFSRIDYVVYGKNLCVIN